MKLLPRFSSGILGCALLANLGLAGSVPVAAQSLVPADFFNAPIDPAAPTAVEAEELVFDSVANVITARGDVVLRLDGYVITGERLLYRRASGDMEIVGNATVTDPSGNVTESPTIALTGNMRRAVLDALTITAYDGSRITADSVDFDRELETILTNAQYAPCGDCIDAEGRRIGWSISAARVVQNNTDNSITFEQPTLSLLGIPVAYLPYLWLPDLSDSALASLPRPSLGYSKEIGLKVEVPVSVYSTRWTDIVLTPTLVTNQGFLLGAEWVQRFDAGSMRIKASGLYQFNPEAFDFEDAQRDWRGAIQADGSFVPLEDWEAGFSYAAFTDSAYFEDYLLDERRAGVNEVYATHVSEDSFIDARIQQFNRLGDRFDETREQQGIALPNVRVERSFRLAPGSGQVDVEARMLNVYREREYTSIINGTAFDHGYGGTRLHGMAQVNWQNQIIAGGAVITPFAGVRIDAAGYDRDTAGFLDADAVPPADGTLLGATPIAALDIRYPMAAYGAGVTHLIEPIAQVVYRGASSIMPGITNEDAKSVVLDDANIFSFNRFTGIDRQETGLRANLGGRYLLDFKDGNYLELIAGQSFQLAGENAFADPNRLQVGVGSGLEDDASYAVLGAYGVLFDTVKAGGKLQLDAGDLTIARASLGAAYVNDRYSAEFTYRFAEENAAAGNTQDLHEAGAEVSVPVDEYWSVSTEAWWDLSANSFLQAGGGIDYNDGYLNIGASAVRTGPTHSSPDDTRIMATFRLLAPAGLDVGYSGAVPGFD